MASSAKSRTFDEREFGRSLIQIKKRVDHRTEPWGTPDVTLAVSETARTSITFV